VKIPVTRADRIIAIVAYVVAFAVLFTAAAALGASFGPLEFIVVLVLAIPVSFLIARGVRAVTSRDARPRT
jgi:hypothetical protein